MQLTPPLLPPHRLHNAHGGCAPEEQEESEKAMGQLTAPTLDPALRCKTDLWTADIVDKHDYSEETRHALHIPSSS